MTADQGAPPLPQPIPPPTSPWGAPYAEWWKRVLASIIDWFVFAIPGALIWIPAVISFFEEIERQQGPYDPTYGPGFQGWFSGTWAILGLAMGAYQVVLNGNQRGQTLGKMVMKIQTRRLTTGGPLGYARAFGRYVVKRALSMFTCGIGGLVDVLFPLWDPQRQTIHDKALDSVVVDLSAGTISPTPPAGGQMPSPPPTGGQMHQNYVGTGPPPPTAGDTTLGGMIPYRNKYALIGYYLAVFSVIPFLGIPLGIAALVLGILGLRLASGQPTVKGKAHAWFAIIAGGLFGFGYLILLIALTT